MITTSQGGWLVQKTPALYLNVFILAIDAPTLEGSLLNCVNAEHSPEAFNLDGGLFDIEGQFTGQERWQTVWAGSEDDGGCAFNFPVDQD